MTTSIDMNGRWLTLRPDMRNEVSIRLDCLVTVEAHDADGTLPGHTYGGPRLNLMDINGRRYQAELESLEAAQLAAERIRGAVTAGMAS